MAILIKTPKTGCFRGFCGDGEIRTLENRLHLLQTAIFDPARRVLDAFFCHSWREWFVIKLSYLTTATMLNRRRYQGAFGEERNV